MTRAAIYCRISRDRTGERAGVERQEADCRSHVKHEGWTLTGVYVDNDLSAYSGKPRPQFDRLLSAVEAGAVDVIVAWHPDRLTRHPRELEDLIDALDGCDVSTVRAGRWDLSTRSGRTQARLVGTMARDESEAKSERTRAALAAKAAKGEYHGSTRHYGYEPDGKSYRVKPDEAAVIREAAARILRGESASSVVTWLNAEKTPTVKGAAWRLPTLKRTLTSWTVCGRRSHRGADVGEAQWEPILSRAERDQLHALLYDPARGRSHPARVSLLAGLAYCAECGAKLRSARRQNGRRVMTCPPTTRQGCGGVQVGAEPLEQVVTLALLDRLDAEGLSAAVAAEAATGVDDATLAELERVESELDVLAADTTLSQRELLVRRQAFVEKRDALRASLSNGRRGAVLADLLGRPLSEQWDALSLDRKRAVVSAVIGRVDVSRATRRGPSFDAERVQVDWLA